jgi:hypothetical protein
LGVYFVKFFDVPRVNDARSVQQNRMFRSFTEPLAIARVAEIPSNYFDAQGLQLTCILVGQNQHAEVKRGQICHQIPSDLA